MEEVAEKNLLINGIDNLESDGNTSFLRAARNGQLEKVLEHLKTNIDINTSNANGLNALHLASKDGHVEIVEELLKRGAIVDAATKKGNTALHIASLAGQEEVVKLLVHHGASVNVQSQNGFTPLYMAAQENHDNVVKFLLANGANQSLSTEDGFTPLAVAMQQGHDKVVTVLLENDTRGKVRLPALHIAAKKDDVRAAKLLLENDHNPDVTSKSGFTPLHIASHYGNQPIANLLIQKGADVNYSAKHNITPLHVAAKWGKNNMVAVLLEQGAHIEAKTRDGLTPLHCAARSGHEQVVDMLLEKSAPISSKTKNGLAPLHMAAQGDHVDAARILLYHRAPVDEVTVDYLTALHVAAHCGHVRVAKLLLDRQADANARALNGFTPLHIACKKNRIKVVELLLKHGACIGATTESGLTPLHVASFMGCMNIVIYLLQHDASPDIPTVRGETPLHLAARANQTDIIRILLRNGAQVDARAREQQTPLHIASRLGNVDIVMLLLQHGAKVDNSTKDMYTALHIAAKEGQDEVAAVLIENGASLNATTKKGFTPLHLAAKYGHLKVAKLLVQKEAPVDAQGKNGVTPLHVASHYDHQNVALLLLDKGASPHANAKNGHTPLHIAARKNQMDIAHTLLEYGAQPDAESKAGFTPLHLSSQEGHSDISALLLEHKATPGHQSKNGLTPMHLCAQENKVGVAEILHKNGAEIDVSTKGGYTPLHIACHYGQADMVKFLLSKGADVKATTSIGYTPLHQAAQQGHTNIVNILLENSAQPNAVTNSGQTALHIAQKLGYITVIDTLKEVTESTQAPSSSEEKYRVVAPEAMQETYLSDSEEEGEDTLLGDQTYRYLTADEMKSLGDDSLPIDVTRDERIDSNRMVGSDDLNAFPPRNIEDSISPEHIHPNYVEYFKNTSDNIDISKHPLNIGFLVSFLVDARGGAMRGCRHSGVRIIVPPRCAHSPTRITCRYVRPQRTPHPPPLMEGEALASRVLELGPVSATFLGPVIIEVPHFAALRGKEREIVVLRSDNGESWKEHTVEATEEVLNEILRDSFDAEDLNQLEDASSGRITRIVTQDFPQYFAVISRIKQEVHAIGPEGGMVSSTVVPQVQAVFPQGALTKKIKVGLQAQPIDPELTAKMLGHGVAVSPVVTVEPRRRKFHKAITLSMPAPRAHSQGMINQYSGSAPTLRLLCSITGGTSRAQWEDVTGSTPLTFVNDCVSFTTTVSARFWLMDCRNIGDATKMATELYREALHVPFIAKFMVFAKRIDPLEARLRVFCMTDDKEEKTLEYQEQFTEIAKSRDVEVLEGKSQYIEFVGNLIPVTKSGEQLQFSFRAFKENRLPFSVRVKDQHAEAVSRCLFMREPKVQKGEPPQQPICILNILLPDDIVSDTISLTDSDSVRRKYFGTDNFDYYRQDPRLADISNHLGEDWVQLANQLGLTSSEINVIKSEYPDSVAKQAQSMLRMWLSQSGNRTQANTLDNALRRIGRDDIVNKCLNEDNRSQQILRIKPEEKGKQRLRDEISAQHDFREDDYYLGNEKGSKMKSDTFDKYSAEEKTIEPSDEEEDFSKTVPERREQIVKRLSNERTIPASSQRVEIVQEISSIKRKSLVEDKIAEVQQKTNIEPIKIITVKPTTKISQQKETLAEVPEAKITDHEQASDVISKAQETEEKTRTNVSNLESQVDSDRRDSILLEEVTHRLESKKQSSNLIADEDPKSPKFSKTPPPSPADFIMREKEATIAQECCATKTVLTDVSNIQHYEPSEDIQGNATSPQYLDKLEEKLLDKTIDTYVVKFSNTEIMKGCDFKQTLNETNAFLKFECEAEPYDVSTDILFKNSKSEIESTSNTTPENKKSKKGIFKTLKSFITKSTEHLDSVTDRSLHKKYDEESESGRSVSTAPTKTIRPDECILKSGNENLVELVEESRSMKNAANERKYIGDSTHQVKEARWGSSKELLGTRTEAIQQEIKADVLEETTDYFTRKNQNQTEVSVDEIQNEHTGIIQKENKLVSEDSSTHLETSKKTGFWSFLSKKPKKTNKDEDEMNVCPENSSEIHSDKLRVTNTFLQQEKKNYDYNWVHYGTRNQENELSIPGENQLQDTCVNNNEIPRGFFSKLKLTDYSPTHTEPSYIKFDEYDLANEPMNIVSHEKQKKVTFEETVYEEKLPLEEADDQNSPQAQRLICRLKSNDGEVHASNIEVLTEGTKEEYEALNEKEVNLPKRQKNRVFTEVEEEINDQNMESFSPGKLLDEENVLTDLITQNDNLSKTEKVPYDVEFETPIVSTIETAMKTVKPPASEIPLSRKSDNVHESVKNEQLLHSAENRRIDDFSDMNESCKDEKQRNEKLKVLSAAFIKNEIIQYNDVKINKLGTDSLSKKKIPTQHDKETKSERLSGLFGRKKKVPKERESEDNNEKRSLVSNFGTRIEQKQEEEENKNDIVLKKIESGEEHTKKQKNISKGLNFKLERIFKIFDRTRNGSETLSCETETHIEVPYNESNTLTSDLIEITKEFLKNEKIVPNEEIGYTKENQNGKDVISYLKQTSHYPVPSLQEKITPLPIHHEIERGSKKYGNDGEPTLNVFLSTYNFLVAEKEFNHIQNNSEKISNQHDLNKQGKNYSRIISDKSQDNELSENTSEKEIAESKNNFFARNNLPNKIYIESESRTENIESGVQNNIQSTDIFLQLEKESYYCEKYKNQQYGTNYSFHRQDSRKKQHLSQNSNISRTDDDYHVVESSEISKQGIGKEESTAPEKIPLKRRFESDMLNTNYKNTISEISTIENVPFQEKIKSTFDFLSTERMLYHDVRHNMIRENKENQESSQDEDTENKDFINSTYQENKTPDSRSRRFFRMFGMKSDSRLDKIEDKNKKLDVTEVVSTSKFLEMEKKCYDYDKCSTLGQKKPEIVHIKDKRSKGIFKIFSRKSEEKDKANVENQGEITCAISEKSVVENGKASTKNQNLGTDKAKTSEKVDLFKNSKEMSKQIDVFLKTERNHYTEFIEFNNGLGIKTGDDMYILEAPKIAIQEKLRPEKRGKQKHIFKIFNKKSEEEKTSGDTKVYGSYSEKKTKDNEGKADTFCKNQDSFDIFSKKTKPLKKINDKDLKPEQLNVHSKDDTRATIATTTEFLLKEKKFHNDELLNEPINNDFLIDQAECANAQEKNERVKLPHNKSIDESGNLANEVPCENDTLKRRDSVKQCEQEFEQLYASIIKEQEPHFEVEKLEQKSPRAQRELLKKKQKFKSRPTDSVEKVEKSSGILSLCFRRSKSKERNEVSKGIQQKDDEKFSFMDLQDCKLFLEKEVEMYFDRYSPIESMQLMSTPSEGTEKEYKFDLTDSLHGSAKSSKESNIFDPLNKKPESDHEHNENISQKTMYSNNMVNSADFIRKEVENYQDIAQSKTISVKKNILEIRNLESASPTQDEKIRDIKEYTAFDFIEEEVKNFNKSALLYTDTIDSSFRVETEIEQVDGNEPKEIIKKKITISEKLIEKPYQSNCHSRTSDAILKELVNIDEFNKRKTKQQPVEQQYSELVSTDTSNINTTKCVKMDVCDILPINSHTCETLLPQETKEKLGNIQVEFVQNMRDLELAKGDVVEDVSLLEKKIEIFPNDSEEKITDLDEILPNESIEIKNSKLVKNLETIPVVMSEFIDKRVGMNQGGIDADGSELLDKSSIETPKENKMAVTKVVDKVSQFQDLPGDVRVTENFVKELEIQYHRDKSLLSKNNNIAPLSSDEIKKQVIDEKPGTIFQNKDVLSGFNEIDYFETIKFVPSESSGNYPFVASHEPIEEMYPQNVSGSLTSQERSRHKYEPNEVGDKAQDESSTHEKFASELVHPDYSKRKPLFRIESDEDDSVASVRAKEISNLKFNISDILRVHSPDSKTEITKEDTFAVDSKSDTRIIEDKLRDLGKALDELERLSEITSDGKNELEGKKLRRVERKFERMASETLEPTTHSEQGITPFNPAENDRYQELVSHLSTDEVISFQNEYNNLWDECTFSKSDEWDSKTPESQADVLELPQGDADTQHSESPETSSFREQSPESSTREPDSQVRTQIHDQHQLSEEMKKLLEKMDNTSKQ